MIGRKSLLIVITKAVSAMLGFLGLFLITRYFPEDTYGQIIYTMALVGLFNAFSDLGFATSHIKRISEGRDLDDCLSSYIVVKLLLTGAMVALVVASFYVYTMAMGHPLSDTSIELVLLFVLYFVFYNVAQIATATFDAHMQTAKTQLALVSEMLIRVPLIFFFAIPAGGVYPLALSYVIGGLVVMLVSLTLLYRDHYRLVRPTLVRSYATFAAPLAIMVVIGIVVANIDKVALGYFWSSTLVANYGAAQSILNMLYVFGAALSVLLFPTFSRLHENGDGQAIRGMVQRGERYLSFILTPIVCVFLVFPVLIATVLLSEKYSGAAAVMQVLSMSVLVLALGSVYSTHIVAANRAKDMVWLSFMQLGLLLVLLVIFVPTSFFGIPMLGLRAVGTAYASVITTLTIVLLSRVIVWKLVGLGYNRRMTAHLVAALASLLALFIIGEYYDPTRWYDIILMWAASALAFYGLLFGFKELRREDIRYFRDVLNLKEMLSYFRSELKGGR